MQIRFTVADPEGRRPSREVLVTASATATAADLAAALAPSARGEHGIPTLYAGGTPVLPTAPVGAPPLLDGALLALGGVAARPARHASGVLELHAVGGPDAGHVFRLPPGEHRLGRAAEATLRLQDAELSRVHALLTVASTVVTVADAGSTNGTRIDGQQLGHDPVELTAESRLQVGRSTLQLRVPAGRPAAASPDGEGHVLVNPGPRFVPEVAPSMVEFPDRPPEAARTGLPLLAILLPLVLSGVLAAVTRSPTMLLFGLMSPVLMVASWLSERRGGRRSSGRATAEHARQLELAEERLEVALALEAEHRRRSHPDLAAVLRVTDGPQATLWHRRPGDRDFLELRVGTGTLPAATLTSRSPEPGGPRARPQLDEVPVVVNLQALGVLGIAGSRRRALGLARALVAQVSAWHSPRDVRLVVLVGEQDHALDWGWTGHLPHNRATAENCLNLVGVLAPGRGQVGCRLAELAQWASAAASGVASPPSRAGPSWPDGATRAHAVVVLDGAGLLRSAPGLATLLQQGPSVGIVFIAIDSDAARLPGETNGLIELGQGADAALLQVDHLVDGLQIDEVSDTWAERLARALGPLRDATPHSVERGPPESARLMQLLGADSVTPRRISRTWRDQQRTTHALLGLTAQGHLVVDLVRDGPHVLIGGTTGAGKSELLQTLIVSFALGNRPDEMCFVLVDYKGGSAFSDCARLPHTLGVVTDLDGHLTERALTSLAAELKRRERLLARVGATDIEHYQSIAGPHQPRLPRLVLIIDEFRMLAEELPDFVHGLVRIAALGRSLGIHLVLATQRPGGIISADVRANVGLRIALRVRDPVDSSELVDSPAAADISQRLPGRAYLRSAATPLVQFQTARVGGRSASSGSVPVTVRELTWSALGDPLAPAGGPEDRAGPTDLQLIVEATRAAARADGIPAAVSPWLPPLPNVVDVGALAAQPDAIVVGLLDDPLAQEQQPFAWDLRTGGHLSVAGGPRSGRTTLMRTIAAQVATHFSPADIHVYAVHTGGLAALGSMPHTGAVVSRDEGPRLERLIRRIDAIATERQDVLGPAGFATVAEQREHATRSGDVPLPYLLLLIDGWEGLVAALEHVDHGRPVEELLRLMRDGEPAGLRVAVTGERALLAGRLTSAMGTRLILRITDPMDLVLAGVPASAVPSHQPPGRALLAADHREVQLAALAPDLSGPGQNTRLAEAGAAARERWAELGRVPERLPMRVDPLPTTLTVGALLVDPRHLVARDLALVGLGGDDLSPLGFRLSDGHRRLLLLGAAGTGRSSTLALVAQLMAAAGRRVVWVGARRSAAPTGAREIDGVLAVLGADDVADLVAARQAHPDLVVLVDDAESLLGAPMEPVLLEILRLVDEDDGAVFVATTPAALGAGARGLALEVARWRTGLLLGPTRPGDGELLGARVSRSLDAAAGRAQLVIGGQATPIQLARS